MNCCNLHKNGKYKKWKCSDGYSAEERRAIFLSKKHKCATCDTLVSEGALKCKKCCNYQGDSASYNAKHRWLQRNVVKPKNCQKCGKGNCRIEWANISGKYLRVLTDWIALCVSCHRTKDGNLPPKQTTEFRKSYGRK